MIYKYVDLYCTYIFFLEITGVEGFFFNLDFI